MSLENYLYNTYTKKELARHLACAYGGELPVVPDPLPVETSQPPAERPGKPTYQTQMARQAKLKDTLAEYYPLPIDFTMLCKIVSSHPNTLRKWQQDYTFLRTLPTYLANYFQDVDTNVTHNRVTGVWRAILDIHYYDLCLRFPEQRLPVYETHLPMWLPLRMGLNLETLQLRNYQEQQRVQGLTDMLTRGDYLLPLKPTVPFPENTTFVCAEGCDICAAYKQRQAVETMIEIREVINPVAFRFNPTILTKVYKGNYAAQIMGVEV